MIVVDIYRHGFLFAALTPAERAANVATARERIAKAEARRREAKRQRLAKAAKRRGAK